MENIVTFRQSWSLSQWEEGECTCHNMWSHTFNYWLEKISVSVKTSRLFCVLFYVHLSTGNFFMFSVHVCLYFSANISLSLCRLPALYKQVRSWSRVIITIQIALEQDVNGSFPSMHRMLSNALVSYLHLIIKW